MNYDFFVYLLSGDKAVNINLFAPQRGAKRVRQRERLLIFLYPASQATLPNKERENLLNHLARHYFETLGSATKALRELAFALNLYLLKRNRRVSSPKERVVMWLGMAVWRGDALYLALSGQLHALVGAKGRTLGIYAPSTQDIGLGLGKSTHLHFATAKWEEGAYLLIAPSLPPALRAAGSSWAPGDVRAVGEAVLQAREEIQCAALITTSKGEGVVHRLPLEQIVKRQPQPPQQITEAQTERPRPLQEQPRIPPRPGPQPHPAASAAKTQIPKPKEPITATIPSKTEPKPSPKSRLPRINFAPVVNQIRKVGQALWQAGEGVKSAIGRIFAGMLPAEDLFALPKSLMALIAVAVPLVIVTMAAVVYIRRGRAEQYSAYFARAETEAAQALKIKEPIARHNALLTALADLDTAEAYMKTKDSRALRQRLEKALDSLDGIRRLNFVPALSRRAPPNTVFRRIVLQGGDMYALDSVSGKVLHFQQDGALYRPDDDFLCEPRDYGALHVSKLVDIAPLSLSENGYRIVGMDAEGDIIRCAPGKQPLVSRSAPPAPLPWKSPRAIAYVGGDLYVLDTGIHTIEIIGNGPTFDGTPYSYFTGEIPSNIDKAIDFAVSRGNLYLLFNTGEMDLCRHTPALEKTECTPLKYHDARPGRSDGPVIPDAHFIQIAMQPPPDPSLFLLDSQEQAVYQFSLQLRFVTQFRPREPLENHRPITAFAIDPDTRILFIAVGPEIYQAPID